MGQVVDSDVFIELERRSLPLTALRDIAPDDQMWLAAITESELWVGFHRAGDSRRAARRRGWIERIVGELPVLPFDSDVARVHARLTAEMVSRGQVIGAHDLLIAATAVRHSGAVLTNNVAEFGRVPGLVVRTPSWPG